MTTNYSNPNAQNPDEKFTPQEASYGTVLDPAAQARRASTALAAETKWLNEISQENGASHTKSNKLRLVSTATIPGSEADSVNTGNESVTFELSPEISESHQAIYTEISAIRSAGSVLIYNGSPSRRWQVNAKFLSRTPLEAGNTWKTIQLLKSWTKPDVNYRFGNDAQRMPHVLRMYGYGRTWMGVPVVITSLSVEYPIDVDYVAASQYVGKEEKEYGTLVPIVQTVSFQLTESRNVTELWHRFDLDKFKLGMMEGW